MTIRAEAEVVRRCSELADELRAALSRLPHDGDDPAVVEAVWHGEGLGALLWSLGLVAMPPYDEPFDHARLLELPFDGTLSSAPELEQACETARLWHWRARMRLLEDDPTFELPPPWTSHQELVASVAARGHEQGLLPAPVGDDFPALGFVYRWATAPELVELRSIAYERHRALAWVCDASRGWDDAALDT
jgi:hypothetical protein